MNPMEGPDGPVPVHDRMLELAEKYENIRLDLDDWQRRDTEGMGICTDFMRRASAGPAHDIFGTSIN
jgi:hypothetical protein